MSSYTVEQRGDCTLVFAEAIPVDALSRLTSHLPKSYVFASRLADLAGACIAWGPPEAVKALERELEPVALTTAEQRYADSGLSDAIVRWLGIGEHGDSSLAMLAHLASHPATVSQAMGGPMAHPLDPADLRRCRLLLETCPELRPQFPHMRELSPVWARLVDDWEDLCRLMDQETPDWRNGVGGARATYARMRALLDGKPVQPVPIIPGYDPDKVLPFSDDDDGIQPAHRDRK